MDFLDRREERRMALIVSAVKKWNEEILFIPFYRIAPIKVIQFFTGLSRVRKFELLKAYKLIGGNYGND